MVNYDKTNQEAYNYIKEMYGQGLPVPIIEDNVSSRWGRGGLFVRRSIDRIVAANKARATAGQKKEGAE